MGLLRPPFRVDGRALVPRPETEVLVEQALQEAPDARRVLDAGTGSGIIAITYLLERPEARAVALDISLDALALARQNAAAHGVLPRLALLASDWLSALAPVAASTSSSRTLRTSRSASRRTCRRRSATTIPRRALFAGDGRPRGDPPAARHRGAVSGAGRPARLRDRLRPGEAVRSEILARPVWRFVKIEPDLEGIPRICLARLESAAERVGRIRKPWTSS